MLLEGCKHHQGLLLPAWGNVDGADKCLVHFIIMSSTLWSLVIDLLLHNGDECFRQYNLAPISSPCGLCVALGMESDTTLQSLLTSSISKVTAGVVCQQSVAMQFIQLQTKLPNVASYKGRAGNLPFANVRSLSMPKMTVMRDSRHRCSAWTVLWWDC
jgi:hypothetical protein